jgi:hypothetical protein
MEDTANDTRGIGVDQARHDSCLKTRCTTLVPMPNSTDLEDAVTPN